MYNKQHLQTDLPKWKSRGNVSCDFYIQSSFEANALIRTACARKLKGISSNLVIHNKECKPFDFKSDGIFSITIYCFVSTARKHSWKMWFRLQPSVWTNTWEWASLSTVGLSCEHPFRGVVAGTRFPAFTSCLLSTSLLMSQLQLSLWIFKARFMPKRRSCLTTCYCVIWTDESVFGLNGHLTLKINMFIFFYSTAFLTIFFTNEYIYVNIRI